VEQVGWDEAQAYSDAAGMRLPAEAEFEYAARGGNPSARYGMFDSVAWYSNNSGGKTHQVGQKPANGFGLFDRLGNVWQSVADWYEEKYYGQSPAADPTGPGTGQWRVQRGGSSGDNPSNVRFGPLQAGAAGTERLCRVPVRRGIALDVGCG
jgi:formylglycine-generating enzyme required for sulfatase activity